MKLLIVSGVPRRVYNGVSKKEVAIEQTIIIHQAKNRTASFGGVIEAFLMVILLAALVGGGLLYYSTISAKAIVSTKQKWNLRIEFVNFAEVSAVLPVCAGF